MLCFALLAVIPKGKAASMLGFIPPGMLGPKVASVLNARPDSTQSVSQTPDLFSFDIAVELKGQIAMVDVGGSTLVSDVMEKAIAALGEKAKKDAADRALFYKETSIFLPAGRRIDSFLWTIEPGEVLELSLKKKDKKEVPMIVLVEGKTEMIDINPNTTVQGVIQLLPRRGIEDDFLTLYNKKGKLDWPTKVASLIKKDEAMECKLDPELKASGGFKDKKKSRKSMAPLKKPITPSASASSIPSKDKEKDKKNLERLLGNRPSEADLKKKNIIVDFKTDAKASAPAAVDPNSALPLQLKLFQQLGAFLKDHLELVGLFRVSGDVEEVKAFYTSMWGKIDWNGTQKDPHIVSSALKLYLRKQTDPLIPFQHYSEFLTAQKIEDDDAQQAAIKVALAKLPEPNASILHYLMHLLTLVADKEPSNKMNPINIGIVFGPTIMWDPKPNVMDYSSTGYQSNLVTNLIQHYSIFWTTPAPSDAQFTAAASGDVESDTSSSVGAGASPGSSVDTSSIGVLEHSLSDPFLGRSHSPSRPQPMRPMPPGGLAGGPPKRMPPKMPAPPPSLVGGAGGASAAPSSTTSPGLPNGGGLTPSSSSEQLPIMSGAMGGAIGGGVGGMSPSGLRNAGYRKSLPPNMIPPAPPSLVSLPEDETGSFNAPAPVAHHERAGSSGPFARPSPPNGSPLRSRFSSASLSKYDSLLQSVEAEIRDNLPLGSSPSATSCMASPEELRVYLTNMSHTELVKHTLAMISAAAGKNLS